MISVQKAEKRFGDIPALCGIDLEIGERQVFGLVGTNGAGKSTLLRMIAGIYRPDSGSILADGEPVFENVAAKQKIFFIPDDWFSFPNASISDMIAYFRLFYPSFDAEKAAKICDDFGLDTGRRIKTFSKGMKKQAALALGLSSGTKYLLLDETFDGLDPVMRQAAKSLIAQNLMDLGQTPVIASHNLRELEDICDRVGLMHRGGILLSKDLDVLRTELHRIQCVLPDGVKVTDIPGLDIVRRESRGRVQLLVVRGEEQAIREAMERTEPVFFEIIPLTLEEIFISETEVAGYDIKSILF